MKRSAGANIATAQAYIVDVTTSENRAKGLGLFGAAIGLGFVVGPALGAGLAAIGYLVSGPERGSAWPAFGAAGIALIAALLVWRYLPESVGASARSRMRFGGFSLAGFRQAMVHPRLRELMLVVFGVTFAFVLLEATFVYLCARRFGLAEGGTGLLFAYIGTVMVIVQGGLVGRLVPRFGEIKLFATGPFITAVGFLTISAVPMVSTRPVAWTLLLVGCFIVPFGHGLTAPNLNALVSRQAPGGRQGMTFGLSQGLASLARALAPPLAGLLYDHGPQWPYWVGAALLVLVGGFAVSIAPVQRAALARQSE